MDNSYISDNINQNLLSSQKKITKKRRKKNYRNYLTYFKKRI